MASIDATISSTMASRSIPRSGQASAASSPSPAPTGVKSPTSSKPKARDTVMSFLTFREPSIRAMKRYEKELKQRQGRSTGSPAGLPMASSQRLPSHVPKVNSRWDGIPDQAKQRAKRLVPPQAMSSPSLRHDSQRDEVASIDSRFTGSSSLGRGNSSLWSSPQRDFVPEGRSSSVCASSVSLTNSVQIYNSGASCISPTTSEFSTTFSTSVEGNSTYAPSQGARSLRPNVVFTPSSSYSIHRRPSCSETGSISTTYTTPHTPPPVPPEYLETASGHSYPNPLLRPKNSDGSLMLDSHEQHEYFDSVPLPPMPKNLNDSLSPPGPHPFRKLRIPRPPEEAFETTQTIPKKAKGTTSDASAQKQRPPRLSLRPKSLMPGKQSNAEEPLRSAPLEKSRGHK